MAGSMMGGGGDSYVAGYRYYAGLHLVFCSGLDQLLQIGVGDKTAWSGTVSANDAITINQPELFGGEDREGGIQGTVDICFGAADQGRNSYLQSILGTAIPAFRGLVSLVARHVMVSANNPYIKSWWIMGQRTRSGWRDDLADIGAGDGFVDMNPAHIIRETLTNTTWGGLGYPAADLDDASFQTAANLLKAEGLGLSLLWAKNTSADDFINIILNHINGVRYFAHDTGLLTLRLIRNDYNIGALAVLDASSIIDLVEFTTPAAAELINQVTVNYVDRDNRGCAVTVQDIAGIERTSGQINAETIGFVGIADGELAARIAARELTQRCLPTASCTLVVNRKHSHLEPGDCFNFTWAPLGIVNMVMRVLDVEVGDHSDGSLRIKAVRDVYGVATSALSAPANSLWTNPLNPPAQAVRRQITEITWWQFVRQFGDAASVLNELDDDSTLVTSYCGRPSSDALNYEMWTRNTGATDWLRRDQDSFPWTGTLVAGVVPELSSALVMAEPLDLNLILVGDYAALEGELVAITAIDPATNTITVDRGVLDTIPIAHSAGSVLWCHAGLFGLDSTDRTTGESVEVRILPSTGLGRLPLADAPTDTLTTVGRMMRPYPPGNVQINGSRWPEIIGAAAELALTWSHRNRITQTVTLNRQDEGDIGPEAGVTYTLRIYDETDTLKKTVIGLTDTSYTWATEIADCGLGRLNTSLRCELETVRDGLTSLRHWDLALTRI